MFLLILGNITERAQIEHPTKSAPALFALDRDWLGRRRAVRRAQMRKMDPAGNSQFVACHDILYFYRYRDGTVVRFAYDTCNNCHLFHTEIIFFIKYIKLIILYKIKILLRYFVNIFGPTILDSPCPDLANLRRPFSPMDTAWTDTYISSDSGGDLLDCENADMHNPVYIGVVAFCTNPSYKS